MHSIACFINSEATEGRNEADAINMCNNILLFLPSAAKQLLQLDKIQAPYFRNLQVTIPIIADAPDDSAYLFSQEINAAIKSQAIHVSNKPVHAVGDSAQWKKIRNATLARASSVVENELMMDGAERIEMTMDWQAGRLWGKWKGQAFLLGSWNRNKGWIWRAVSIMKMWPKASTKVIELAVDMS